MSNKMLKINEYMNIGEAAKFLGVCIATLRNWDRKGKFKARRNPINNYRYYSKKDLLKILNKIESGEALCAKTGKKEQDNE